MMMTAAGTVSPAKVFVMGVGVAGLQAIATARRLGAQVSATDVRSATREQIMSLGAKPIFVENVAGIEGEGAGGYAGEMSARISGGAGRTGVEPHRQAGHRHHHRADPRPARAAADQRCPAGDDARRAAWWSISPPRPAAMSKAASRARRVVRHGVTIIGAVQLARTLAGRQSRRCSRATSTISSAPSGTRKRASRCFPTMTRSSSRCESRPSRIGCEA